VFLCLALLNAIIYSVVAVHERENRVAFHLLPLSLGAVIAGFPAIGALRSCRDSIVPNVSQAQWQPTFSSGLFFPATRCLACSEGGSRAW
jgi:hypothetical protein